MSRRTWTEREDALLHKYHVQGMRIGDQAFQLNRPYGSVCTRRKQLGLAYPNSKRGPAENKKIETTHVEPLPEFEGETLAPLKGLAGLVAVVVGTLFGIITYGVFF